MVDDFQEALKVNKPLIINTDISGGPGVHWIVAVLRPKGGLYIYDPLGPANDRVDSMGEHVDQYLRKQSKGAEHKLHLYPHPSQIRTTGHCGWFSIYVAKLLKRYLDVFPDISNEQVDQLIVKRFGRTADWGDVRKLIEALDLPNKKVILH